MEVSIHQGKIKCKSGLVDDLVSSGYAFAIWKQPHEDKTHFVISLNKPEQTEKPLNELDAGFLVNRFEDHHKTKPFLIAADIVVQNDQLSFDPRVAADQQDDFYENLSQTTHITKNSETITPEKTNEEFEQQVVEAVQAIKEGRFEKVVLSRYKDLPIPDHFSAWEFLVKLNETYSGAFTSLVFLPGQGLWMGASPELLLSDDESSFKTVALAGTKSLEQIPLTEVAWTQKEIEEQALVSRYIVNCFKKLRLREFHEHGPKTVKAGLLAHLKTDFEVKYIEASFENLASQMLDLMHPTSAVCGMPLEEAVNWIKEKEKYDRSFYSGFLGPVNFDGSTQLYVNLRCMRIMNERIRLFAGAGITEDSNPAREFLETEMKMDVLGKLIR
ncbi:MAG: isochorismate synthase [Ekhidna sp.]